MKLNIIKEYLFPNSSFFHLLLSSLILPLLLLPTGHRSGVLTAPHDQLGRESAVPQLPARLQRALQGPGPSPAPLAWGHQGAPQLQHLTRPLSTFRAEVLP